MPSTEVKFMNDSPGIDYHDFYLNASLPVVVYDIIDNILIPITVIEYGFRSRSCNTPSIRCRSSRVQEFYAHIGMFFLTEEDAQNELDRRQKESGLLKSKLTSEGTYVKVGSDMIYPNPSSERISNIEWCMRHAKDKVTDGDLTIAASILSAYRGLILEKTQKDRNAVCVAIKNVSTE